MPLSFSPPSLVRGSSTASATRLRLSGSTLCGRSLPFASNATTTATLHRREGVVSFLRYAAVTVGETTKCHDGDNDDEQQQLEFHSFYKRRGESALATMCERKRETRADETRQNGTGRDACEGYFRGRLPHNTRRITLHRVVKATHTSIEVTAALHLSLSLSLWAVSEKVCHRILWSLSLSFSFLAAATPRETLCIYRKHLFRGLSDRDERRRRSLARAD